MWDCGQMKSKPLVNKGSDPKTSGAGLRSVKIKVLQSVYPQSGKLRSGRDHRFKMEPDLFNPSKFGNTCQGIANYYNIKGGITWGCADLSAMDWWSGPTSKKYNRGNNVYNRGKSCNTISLGGGKGCINWVQGGNPAGNDTLLWWKQFSNYNTPKDFWAYIAEKNIEGPPGARILYISQAGSSETTKRFKYSWSKACCGWSPYFSIWVYQTRPQNIPENKLKKIYISQKSSPHHKYRVSSKSASLGWRDTTSFWVYKSDPGNIAPSKLNECEGDCDSDRDCAPGLKCFQRSSSSSLVPGCMPGGRGDNPTHDYCYNPKPKFSGGTPPSKHMYFENGKMKAIINNKVCGLEWDSNIKNGRRNAKWDCENSDRGDPWTTLPTNEDVMIANNQICRISHNRSDKGIVRTEWECDPGNGTKFKINPTD